MRRGAALSIFIARDDGKWQIKNKHLFQGLIWGGGFFNEITKLLVDKKMKGYILAAPFGKWKAVDNSLS
jgi:hypothetical protein